MQRQRRLAGGHAGGDCSRGAATQRRRARVALFLALALIAICPSILLGSGVPTIKITELESRLHSTLVAKTQYSASIATNDP